VRKSKRSFVVSKGESVFYPICKNRRYLGRGHLPFAERTDQANMTGTRGGRMERLVSDVVYGE